MFPVYRVLTFDLFVLSLSMRTLAKVDPTGEADIIGGTVAFRAIPIHPTCSAILTFDPGARGYSIYM